MHRRDTAEEAAFRSTVREWLEDNLAGEFAGVRGTGGPGREHEAFEENSLVLVEKSDNPAPIGYIAELRGADWVRFAHDVLGGQGGGAGTLSAASPSPGASTPSV